MLQRARAYNRLVARAPEIRIGCECGETGHAAYGETWACTACGRRWNTAQIPAEAYGGRRRRMRRLELEIVGFGLVVLLVFVPLVLFVDGRLIFSALIVAAAWMFLYMPFWRRRVQRAAAEAPKWELHPE
jgi:hypothetical protein